MDNLDKIIIGLMAVTLILLVSNTYQLKAFVGTSAGVSIVDQTKSSLPNSAYNSAPDIIPKGTPEIYGSELGVRYDDVSQYNPQLADNTIRKLKQLDKQITLEGSDKERYINILYKIENGISCEYCCGARAIIFENGDAACGCAHSYAMRGLTKYLITKHGNEYSDEQILTEIAKWKTLFFPSQIQLKAQILEAQGIEPSYINVASNKYRGIERSVQGNAGGMVGGC